MLVRPLMAFQSNIDRLKKDGRLYLWTFTLSDCVAYLDLRIAWNRLLTYLKRQLPSWAGVRVYEVHPGKWNEFSHGLHVHVVCNKFHKVDLIRDVAKSARWGRVHVQRLRPGTEYYAGKYLSKERPPALKGWRLQATFGMPLGFRTRLCDIVCESMRDSLFRIGHALDAFRGLGWQEKLSTVATWHWQIVAGESLFMPSVRGHRCSAELRPRADSLNYPLRVRSVAQAVAVRSILGQTVPISFDPNRSTSAGADDRQISDFRKTATAAKMLSPFLAVPA